MKTYIKKSLLVISAALLMGSAFAQTCNINPQSVSLSGPTCVGASVTNTVSISGSQTDVLYSLYANGSNQIGLPQLGTGGALNFSTGTINQGTTTFAVNAQPVDPTFNSLLFSGTSAWGAVNPGVDLGSSISSVFDNTNLITIEAWVYPTSSPTNGDELKILSNRGANGPQFELVINNSYPVFHVFLSPNFNDHYGILGFPVPLNTWTHLAATWDGTTIRIFQNGIETRNTAVTGNFPAISTVAFIGSQNTPSFFDGYITDVRIWNIARSQSDINTNKNKCINVASPGLLAYYKMSDGVGSATLTDATGHGYNGTLINMNVNTDWAANVPAMGCGCTVQMAQQYTVTFSPVVGDVNCSFAIDNGEIAGDINRDGTIGVGEAAGDLSGNGLIDGGEAAGDISGDGLITNTEIPGDKNGNGVINGTEIQGDYTGNGVLGPEDNFITVSGLQGINSHLNGIYLYDGIVNGKPSYYKHPLNGGDCSSIVGLGGNTCNFDMQTWVLWDNTKWKFFANIPQCQWEAAFDECVPAAVGGGSGMQTYVNSLDNIYNTTNSYYPPCGIWQSSGFLGTAMISGSCRNTPSAQNITGNTSVCRSGNASISVASTETNAFYYLRNNSNNAIVAGPKGGTGSSITFSTGIISTTATYNVYAHNIGDSTNCHIQMPNLITVTVNQPTIVGDANCSGTIDVGEIAGDTNYNGTIGAGEVAGDTNGSGTIGAGETAGDINGNGTIGAGETAGDTNGNGTIGVGEVAGDNNGNGTIGVGETAGDTNGNGTIGAGEVAGDTNGNGTIGAGETAGDTNGNGTIEAGEVAGDTNGNGTIGAGETAGDTNGNGTIGAGEIAGDTNGNGTIGAGELAGDTNGNGTIGAGEIAGDNNGNGTIGAGEVAGDTNGNGTIGAGETAGDTNGNGTIGAGEITGDTNGSGTIGAGEITGDTNGNGTIGAGETCGDTNGDGTISGGELTGDIDGDGTIGSGETFGDSNGNGTIDSGETVGIAKKNLTDDIKVYPNPSSGIFVVEGFSKGEKFNVVNALGEIVMSITTTNTKTKIDLSNKANGVYFIKTNNGYTHKLVKQD